MKFGNNQLVTKTVQYLEKKISKMIDFDQQKSVFIEQQSVFTEMVMHMSDDNELTRGMQLESLIQKIDEKHEAEKARSVAARNAKSEPTVYKTEPEIINLEACYQAALDEVAPEKELKGLSALEYCSMCIYYDS